MMMPNLTIQSNNDDAQPMKEMKHGSLSIPCSPVSILAFDYPPDDCEVQVRCRANDSNRSASIEINEEEEMDDQNTSISRSCNENISENQSSSTSDALIDAISKLSQCKITHVGLKKRSTKFFDLKQFDAIKEIQENINNDENCGGDLLLSPLIAAMKEQSQSKVTLAPLKRSDGCFDLLSNIAVAA